MRLTDAQLGTLERAFRTSSEAATAAAAALCFERHAPLLAGRLHAAVSWGIARAVRLGARAESGARCHLALMFLLGSHYDVDPRFPEVAAILADEGLGSMDARLGRALDEAVFWLGESHGGERDDLPRAFVRLCETTEGVADEAGFVARARASFSEERVRQVYRAAVASAESEGWEGAEGITWHAGASLLFGVGYHHDLLLPELSRVLDATRELGAARASALKRELLPVAQGMLAGPRPERGAPAPPARWALLDTVSHQALRRFVSEAGAARLGELTVPSRTLEEVVVLSEGPCAADGPHDAIGRHRAVPLGPGEVIVEARTQPHDASMWREIAWTGGDAVAGAPARRRVRCAAAAHHRLVARAGEREAWLDLWVLHARLSLRLSGELDGVRLGVRQRRGKSTVRVGVIAELEPRGVERFVRAGWRIESEVVTAAGRVSLAAHPRARLFRHRRVPSTIDGLGHRLIAIVEHEVAPAIVEGFRHWVTWCQRPCSEEAIWSLSEARSGDILLTPSWEPLTRAQEKP